LAPQKNAVLLVHDDGDVLDLLTRLFEAGNLEVTTASTTFRAQDHLTTATPVHAVVAPWDLTHSMGGEIYRWALQRRFDLRAQFVFLASEVPPEFDELVGGRCLTVPVTRPAEVVRVALAAVGRRTAIEKVPDPITDNGARPSLLIAEDDPVLLMVMARWLEEVGFRVSQAENGKIAIAAIDAGSFDVILSDWQMDGGSGADVYAWIKKERPWMTERVVFLSGGEKDDAQTAVPGRPMVRKGQDSRDLLAVLREVVRQVRAEASGLSFLPPT
jgi:DNA-binding response OmpR family regulator